MNSYYFVSMFVLALLELNGRSVGAASLLGRPRLTVWFKFLFSVKIYAFVSNKCDHKSRDIP